MKQAETEACFPVENQLSNSESCANMFFLPKVEKFFS